MARIELLVQSTSGRVLWGRVGVRREARWFIVEECVVEGVGWEGGEEEGI